MPAGPLIGNIFLIRRSGGSAGNGAFGVGVDLGCEEHFAAGVGEVHDCVEPLACVRRQLPNGQRRDCGPCTEFATLLPTRAAQAAQAATLHPNPASTAATLTLAAPVRPGTRLDLTDALGRCVLERPGSGWPNRTARAADQSARWPVSAAPERARRRAADVAPGTLIPTDFSGFHGFCSRFYLSQTAKKAHCSVGFLLRK